MVGWFSGGNPTFRWNFDKTTSPLYMDRTANRARIHHNPRISFYLSLSHSLSFSFPTTQAHISLTNFLSLRTLSDCKANRNPALKIPTALSWCGWSVFLVGPWPWGVPGLGGSRCKIRLNTNQSSAYLYRGQSCGLGVRVSGEIGSCDMETISKLEFQVGGRSPLVSVERAWINRRLISFNDNKD